MTISDRAQIEELMATYANAIDARDYDILAACFTNDATAIYPGFSELLTGPAEIIAHMKRALEPLDTTQHLFANFIIDIEGDAAKLSCGIIAQHLRDGGSFFGGGDYKVDMQRTGGKWAIAKLAARNTWHVGDREMLPKTE